jgi:hypothetical protein
MSDKNQFSTFIYNRLQECRINRRAYEIWLSHLNPWNVVTVVSPAVLSVIAGSTILTEPTFLGEDKGRLLAGIFALLSAVLTTIHKVIGCDVHQSECLRVIQAYSSLEVGYERPLDLHKKGVGFLVTPSLQSGAEKRRKWLEPPTADRQKSYP